MPPKLEPKPRDESPAPDLVPVDTPRPSNVRIMLLCDHVFLPKDPTGSEWRTSADTIRYEGKTEGRRAKLDVHPDLATFLQDRGQAEILD